MEAVTQEGAPPVSALMGELEEVLRRQTEAAQADDSERLAGLGERSLALLGQLGAGLGAVHAGALRRLRDLAAYNQLLLRFAFTSWAAARLDRRRTAQRYDSRGRLGESGAQRPHAAPPRGVL